MTENEGFLLQICKVTFSLATQSTLVKGSTLSQVLKTLFSRVRAECCSQGTHKIDDSRKKTFFLNYLFIIIIITNKIIYKAVCYKISFEYLHFIINNFIICGDFLYW